MKRMALILGVWISLVGCGYKAVPSPMDRRLGPSKAQGKFNLLPEGLLLQGSIRFAQPGDRADILKLYLSGPQSLCDSCTQDKFAEIHFDPNTQKWSLMEQQGVLNEATFAPQYFYEENQQNLKFSILIPLEHFQEDVVWLLARVELWETNQVQGQIVTSQTLLRSLDLPKPNVQAKKLLRIFCDEQKGNKLPFPPDVELVDERTSPNCPYLTQVELDLRWNRTTPLRPRLVIGQEQDLEEGLVLYQQNLEEPLFALTPMHAKPLTQGYLRLFPKGGKIYARWKDVHNNFSPAVLVYQDAVALETKTQ